MLSFLKSLNVLDIISLPGGSSVPVSVFKDIFKNVPEIPTYENFMEIDNEKKGYKLFFEQCREQGIIN
ncbi:hypothetical protein [Salipaludibacillus sp. CF4.18]|uniref:hypothetical protein n=1 Tax=Salipaludibacillus sp. CF4.18 TaxID=3373081 RepID=UPI003EE52B40